MSGGFKGFRCPNDGEKHTLVDCLECRIPCIEIPLLVAMSKERVTTPGVYSTTEILKPPRVVVLSRKIDYWLDPFEMVWSTFGTAYHSIIESTREELHDLYRAQYKTYVEAPSPYLFEEEMAFNKCVELGDNTVVYLTGKPDQYNTKTHVLTDYKTLKWFWSAYYLFEKGDWEDSTYKNQLNIYRWAKFPDCKEMRLEVIIKDYNAKLAKMGVKPVMRIKVPWMEDDEVEAMVVARLRDILAGEKDPDNCRDCTEAERWKNNIRCKKYCVVADHCKQWEELQNG